MKYATNIKQIEIDALWSGKKHILWTLDPHVNILSGINGVGKSTILNKIFRSICTNGDLQNHLLKGVRITAEPEDATHVRFDAGLTCARQRDIEHGGYPYTVSPRLPTVPFAA